MGIEISASLSEAQKTEAARIFYRAFPQKFGMLWLFTKKEERAVAVLRECIDYGKGLYATDGDAVLGLIGLETEDGDFAHLRFRPLSDAFGLPGALWRYALYLVYYLFQVRADKDEIHIEPVAVAAEARGKGIGTKLLNAAFAFARSHDRKFLILEVVDTNPEAQKLYERLGFSVIKVENSGILTAPSGFRRVFHMRKRIGE